jgi:glutathione S-transferase
MARRTRFGGQASQPLDTANTNIAAWMARLGERPSAKTLPRELHREQVEAFGPVGDAFGPLDPSSGRH